MRSIFKMFFRNHDEMVEAVDFELKNIEELSVANAKIEFFEMVEKVKSNFDIYSQGPTLSINLNKLDIVTRELFLKYRKIHTVESDLYIELDVSEAETEFIQIAYSPSDEYVLCVLPQNPMVYEFNKKQEVVDEYKSIYHFILIMEGG